MVPRPLPYPSNHPNKGKDGVNSYPDHFFAVYPEQHHEILRRIYWKRRGYFMAVNIPNLPEIKQISSSIWRILGGNPSKFTLQGTNTYLLGRGKDRILVDTAQGHIQWSNALEEVLEECGDGVRVKTVILTHWHHDHVMGISAVKKKNPNVKVFKHLGNSYDPDGTMEAHTVHDFPDRHRFSVGSRADGDFFEVETLHTPGHAKDHMCLIITESPDPDEVGAMFTADNVLGHGTSVFEDLGLYVNSLKVMKANVGEKKRAFPGHGEVIDDAHLKLEEYITHRQMREDEAMNVLCYGSTVAPGKAPLKTAEGFPQSVPTPEGQVKKDIELGKKWESMEMVKIIYTLYPEPLWGPAEGGLLQVLWKLKGDGKVIRTDDGKWRISDEALAKVREEVEAQNSKAPRKVMLVHLDFTLICVSKTLITNGARHDNPQVPWCCKMGYCDRLVGLYPFPEGVLVEKRPIAIASAETLEEHGVPDRSLIMWTDGSLKKHRVGGDSIMLSASAVSWINASTADPAYLVPLNTFPARRFVPHSLMSELIAVREAFRIAYEQVEEIDHLVILTDSQDVLKKLRSRAIFDCLHCKDDPNKVLEIRKPAA